MGTLGIVDEGYIVSHANNQRISETKARVAVIDAYANVCRMEMILMGSKGS